MIEISGMETMEGVLVRSTYIVWYLKQVKSSKDHFMEVMMRANTSKSSHKPSRVVVSRILIFFPVYCKVISLAQFFSFRLCKEALNLNLVEFDYMEIPQYLSDPCIV